jgi:LPXTG-site transpeptidase (sortase) family protein
VELPNALPATGFAPNVITSLPKQSAEKAYAATDVWLEIPNLGVKNLPIVGVPLVDDAWNLSWLENQAGWLAGTAFPSWEGNSALTGHVTLPNGKPGPFASLGSLKWGDKIIVHAYGNAYEYQVRENKIVAPNDTSVLKHEDKAWLTLLTCKTYNETKNTYANRVSVRAVLMSITKDKAASQSPRGR